MHEQGLFCLGVDVLQADWASCSTLMRRRGCQFAGAHGEGCLMEPVRVGRADIVRVDPGKKP